MPNDQVRCVALEFLCLFVGETYLAQLMSDCIAMDSVTELRSSINDLIKAAEIAYGLSLRTLWGMDTTCLEDDLMRSIQGESVDSPQNQRERLPDATMTARIIVPSLQPLYKPWPSESETITERQT
ncbi:hypothetical protein N7G274_008211 [Stereocaulon virgatum]|uniref:Uncharacterized protein n=1 Tax=Stereocaulon virgatum TaxID=373712 RepID=A0ABR3ZZR2_9LECA